MCPRKQSTAYAWCAVDEPWCWVSLPVPHHSQNSDFPCSRSILAKRWNQRRPFAVTVTFVYPTTCHMFPFPLVVKWFLESSDYLSAWLDNDSYLKNQMNTPRSWFTRVSTGGCRNVVVFFPIWRLIPGRLLFLLPDSHFHLFHSVLQRKTLISVFPLGVYSAEQQQGWFTSVSAAVAHSFVNKCHTNLRGMFSFLHDLSWLPFLFWSSKGVWKARRTLMWLRCRPGLTAGCVLMS